MVTDIGVFEKIGGKETFTLTACIPSSANQMQEKAIAEMKEKVGWKLDVAPDLGRVRTDGQRGDNSAKALRP